MFIKKFIAIILSMVILSNLTVGFAFAQEPATSVVNETEKKTNVEIKVEIKNDIQKLEELNYEKQERIHSLEKEIEDCRTAGLVAISLLTLAACLSYVSGSLDGFNAGKICGRLEEMEFLSNPNYNAFYRFHHELYINECKKIFL